VLGSSINYGAPATITDHWVFDTPDTVFIGQSSDNTNITVAAAAGKLAPFTTGAGNATTLKSTMGFTGGSLGTASERHGVKVLRLHNRRWATPRALTPWWKSSSSSISTLKAGGGLRGKHGYQTEYSGPLLASMLPALDENRAGPLQAVASAIPELLPDALDQSRHRADHGDDRVRTDGGGAPKTRRCPTASRTRVSQDLPDGAVRPGFKVSRLARDDDRHGVVNKFASDLGESAWKRAKW